MSKNDFDEVRAALQSAVEAKIETSQKASIAEPIITAFVGAAEDIILNEMTACLDSTGIQRWPDGEIIVDILRLPGTPNGAEASAVILDQPHTLRVFVKKSSNSETLMMTCELDGADVTGETKLQWKLRQTDSKEETALIRAKTREYIGRLLNAVMIELG